MTLSGEYGPSPVGWIRRQVEDYERSAGAEAATLRTPSGRDTGLPVVIVTSRGVSTGKLRKTPLMRVEHGGAYLLVGSNGGAHEHPRWIHNLRADPDAVTVQDGPEPFAVHVRELEGDERETWWARAVEAFPPYAQYRAGTDRVIPIFLATRV